jgi:ElaB/YqjD/DUF883 family membrane-anchored ribosome-binding protein
MSTDPDNTTPAEAEADAEKARAGLVNTLNQLRENLKPANVVDEVMTNAKAGASVVTDQIWATARQNPVPALLIGAGIAMMLGFGARARSHPSGRRRGAGRRATGFSHDAGPEFRSHVAGPVSQAKPSSSGIGRQVSRAAGAMTQHASDLLDGANQRLGDAASRGAGIVSRAFSSATESVPMPSLPIPRSREQLNSSITRLLEEQPLILGAIGVAVGAAIGAAIPTTERENMLMGETSHSLRDAATSLAKEQYNQVKAAATHAVDDIKQTVAEHGVNPDNLSGLVQDIGEKTKAAAHEAAGPNNPGA